MQNLVHLDHPGALFAAGFAAAVLSAVLIVVLMPLLQRYALARPNARSSHVIPTPQGGGLAVVAATILVSTGLVTASTGIAGSQMLLLAPVLGAVVLLAIVGLLDDIWTLAVLPRLLLQTAAVTAVVFMLPERIDTVPFVPDWMERLAAILIGVWFVNLVNFMDGIDWITVVETASICIGILLVAAFIPLPSGAIVVAIGLLGATVGFAPFNRPVARLFLGDVGSLPIGLILFWLLLVAAVNGAIVAAILLPLYYLADATLTLLQRVLRGEPFTQPHRSHFYQLATQRGLPVSGVIQRVALVNAVLILLALLSVWVRSPLIDLVAVIAGGGAVVLLLALLSRGR